MSELEDEADGNHTREVAVHPVPSVDLVLVVHALAAFQIVCDI